MIKNILKLTLVTMWIMTLAVPLAAQDVEMADTMRADGKIYVVVAVMVVILLGLFTYLLLTEKKIGRLERELTEKDR